MFSLGIIELGLRLACLILEGIPPKVRQEQALVWWAVWKPVLWRHLDDETKAAIEKAVG